MTSLVQSAIANQFCFLVEDMYIYCANFGQPNDSSSGNEKEGKQYC